MKHEKRSDIRKAGLDAQAYLAENSAAVDAITQAQHNIGRSIVRVVPALSPAKAIGSNDVDVIRGVRPSKYAGLDRATRVSFRAAARSAGLSVEEWMTATGNTVSDRGAQPVMESAIQARMLGVRRGNLTETRINGDVAWTSIAAGLLASARSIASAQTVLGLAIEQR